MRYRPHVVTRGQVYTALPEACALLTGLVYSTTESEGNLSTEINDPFACIGALAVIATTLIETLASQTGAGREEIIQATALRCAELAEQG